MKGKLFSKRTLPVKPMYIGVGIIVLFIIAIIPTVYMYSRYRVAQEELANPQAVAQQQAQQVIMAVGKLILLPTDEVPTVATVTDREKLQNQPFFANAANGDKVLIYLKAKKAILYRPDKNQIVDVAPINMTATQSGSATSAAAPTVAAAEATPTPAVTAIPIAIRNGTNSVGLTKTYETTLSVKLPAAVVVDTDTAASHDYTKTYMYDLTGTKSDEVNKLATTLNISVGQLPANEDVSSLKGKADFLIIIGADQQ